MGEKMNGERCSICNMTTIPIEVHGHIQCNQCGQNYSPCCQGETADESCKQTERTERREGNLQDTE